MSETLPRLEPNAARTSRTLSRCHKTLARRREKLAAAARRPAGRTYGVERLMVVGLSIVYLIAAAGNVLGVLSGR
jgi:hypothetical protein